MSTNMREHTDTRDTDPVLAKVRSLLAKAESTTFEAEALAFTAKAHELIARHAIDLAQVESSEPRADHERPVTTDVAIHPPYPGAKSLLLQVVAEANRCRAVSYGRGERSSVVGFASDLVAVEMLFTSLLVQAQSALEAAARHAPAGTRVRSRGYRSSFLMAFANRIGHRLREINDAVLADAEAEHGASLLPALRSRADMVDDHLAEEFGPLTTIKMSGGRDYAGWAGGTVAADNAHLNAGRLGEKGAPPPPTPTLRPGYR